MFPRTVQALLWVTIGLVFAPLAERLLTPAAESPGSVDPVAPLDEGAVKAA